MARDIESQLNPEDNKTFIIGEKQYRQFDYVNYDNGDGIEKNWQLGGFDGEQVRLFKGYGGEQDKNIKDTYLDLGKFIQKTISVDKFIKLQEL